jgi:hypothetical protein
MIPNCEAAAYYHGLCMTHNFHLHECDVFCWQCQQQRPNKQQKAIKQELIYRLQYGHSCVQYYISLAWEFKKWFGKVKIVTQLDPTIPPFKTAYRPSIPHMVYASFIGLNLLYIERITKKTHNNQDLILPKDMTTCLSLSLLCPMRKENGILFLYYQTKLKKQNLYFRQLKLR